MNKYEKIFTKEDSEDIIGLETAPKIYGFYWVRIKASGDLGAVSVNYTGNKFSNDDEMYSYYPALDNQITRDQWEPTSSPGTKVTWQEQGFMASEMIVRDLKTRDEIRESGQVLDAEIFNTPNTHLQAAIIFGGLGRGFEDDRKVALGAYDKSMKLGRKNLDKNLSGKLDSTDRAVRTSFGVR